VNFDIEHKALLAGVLSENRVRCNLCAHHCELAEDQYGLCGERVNRQGQLYTRNFGRLIAAHVDPIEKKPLNHFLPGSSSFSIAAPGCNFRCQWCQNWDISQANAQNNPARLAYTPATEVVRNALRSGCKGISYTYTEPTVFFEYTLEGSKLAHENGIKNVYVTNGFMSGEMLALYLPWLDAANVDIKAFSDQAYRQYMGGRLKPVLDSCKRMKQAGVWLEITTLVVPGVNDDPAQLKELTSFIANELGVDTPWHVSRFYPQYQYLETPPTPDATIRQAMEIGAEAGLRYVYAGNTRGYSDTHCPKCSTLLLRRSGLALLENNLRQGTCPNCGERIAGVWE
jgi:pyruvate formate lyase activating enzyme